MIVSALFLLLMLPLWGPLQPLLLKLVLMVFFMGVSVFQKPAIQQNTNAAEPFLHREQSQGAAMLHGMLAEQNTKRQGAPSMPEALSQDQIQTALQDLPGWRYEAQALHKEFQFKNFREAVSFIVRMSFYAEELNHHPELFNVYNRVTLKLTTHDAGNKVTELDIKLAQAIESFNWSSH